MTESQRQGWDYAVRHAPPALLSRLDAGILAVWVVAEDLHRQACASVAKYGLVTKSPSQGLPMQNPFLPIVNRQAGIMLKAASELGFSPTARARKGMGATGKADGGNRFAKLDAR